MGDRQVRQAEHALRIDFVHFLKRTDWQKRPASAVVDERGHTSPLAALEQLRHRLRTRHYSYRTECSYVDWVRRFFKYLGERQGVPHPRVESDGVRDFATHLAVHRRVSASTQNQALSAILFLCREVLSVEVEDQALATMAKRGIHLPAVLSMPETALLGAMRGTTSVMAALIYGGGLRISECCELRIKGRRLRSRAGVRPRRKGRQRPDRRCWPNSGGTSFVCSCSAQRHSTGRTGRRAWPASGCRRHWSASTRTPVASWHGSGYSPVTPSTEPRAGIVRRHHVSDSVIQKAVKAAAVRAMIVS